MAIPGTGRGRCGGDRLEACGWERDEARRTTTTPLPLPLRPGVRRDQRRSLPLPWVAREPWPTPQWSQPPLGPPSMTLAGAGKRSVSTMRYVYPGDKLTRPELRGQPCDPVRRRDGRCIVGQGKALVRFADGTLCIVLRRRLRLKEKGGLQ